MSSAMSDAKRASPSMTGTIGCSEGTISNPNQSYVELNYCNIEHAVKGILVGKIGDFGIYDYDYSGAIINANNCEFLNNGRAIEFTPYKNMHIINNQTNELVNQSVFDNCEFKTTQLLKNQKILL